MPESLNQMQLNVLMVEDRQEDAELNALHLKKAGYQIDYRRVETERDFLNALENPPDLILIDWSLPRFSGQQAVKLLKQLGTDIPLILVSGSIGEEQAVSAMQMGAYDYVLKDRPGRLGQAVAHALEQKQLRDEQKRVEAALRESEDRFRRLAENAPDLIYRYEFFPERRFEYVSPYATELTGFTPAEHYADPDLGYKIVHPDDREKLAGLGTLDDKIIHPLVLRWVRKDGKIVWTEQRNMPIYDEQNRLIAVEGIARDITERMLAQDRLRRREEILQAVSEIATRFLRPMVWEDDLHYFTARLGESTRCSRVYLMENVVRSDGERTVKVLDHWDAPHLAPIDQITEMIGGSFREVGLEQIESQLSQGKAVHLRNRGSDDHGGKFHELHPIPSFMAIPINSEHDFFGFISLVDENSDREWSSAELDALQTAASIFAAALDRRSAEIDLNKRQAEVERLERVMVDREIRMIELKEKIKSLERELARSRPL